MWVGEVGRGFELGTFLGTQANTGTVNRMRNMGRFPGMRLSNQQLVCPEDAERMLLLRLNCASDLVMHLNV